MDADDEFCATSGLMALLRVIGGVMHKIGSWGFWVKLALTGSRQAKDEALQAAFMTGLNEIMAGCLAKMGTKATAQPDFYEDEDLNPAIFEMWHAVGELIVTDDERAHRRAVQAWEKAWRAYQLRVIYRPIAALRAARMRARLAGWCRFGAWPRLLARLPQIRDEKPVWAGSWNCALFVPLR